MSEVQKIKALTAFVVVIPEDGSSAYATDVFGEYEVQRSATISDIRRGTQEVASDIAARAAAEYVAQVSKSPTVAERVARGVSNGVR